MPHTKENPKVITAAKNHDPSVTLSVSLILKNEEKMLPACLEAIKPLLDAVPSELVIVDTGSSDKTVDIVKQYTDKIYHFDWINDFSAARNFGLEKCRGAWFMFLDADDHFTDVSELIEFFNNESLNRSYNTAFYITRNFTTPEHDKYFNFCAHRIARITDNLKFEGAIHEFFEGWYLPAYYFNNSYANHYGYAFETQADYERKAQRNLILLEKELEKTPDDLRTINHYVSSYLKLDEHRRSHIERAMTLADNSDKPELFTAYFNAFEMYDKENKPEKALEALKRAEAKAKPDDAITAEIHAAKGYIQEKLGQFAEAEADIKKYMQVYRRNENNELDKSALGFVVSNYLFPDALIEMQNTLAHCISKQNRANEALAVYEESDFAAMNSVLYKNTADVILETAGNELLSRTDAEAARKKLISIYERIAENAGFDKTVYFEKGMEKLYYADGSLAKSFKVNCKNENLVFTRLMCVIADESKEELEAFLNSPETQIREGCSAAIYHAVQNHVDLSSALAGIHYELLISLLAAITGNKPDLPVLAVQYKDDDFYFASIKNLLFGVKLYEAAVSLADTLNDSQKADVYTNYAKYAALYVENIYNPDLLNESDIGALPETYRFGFFMGQAQKELDKGNRIEFVRWLKKALISCNSMQGIIKFLLDEFVKTL